ncbi:MAG TPA: TVP38/TMEM64 family protein [Thermoanaerobaculia bacterium]|nr:TVP38/TMEM64 family protein [Thermoanaerobaculia bacterium]
MSNDPAAPEPPTAAPARGSLPRRHLLRFLILGAIVVGGFAALRFTPLRDQLSLEAITALLVKLRASWWAPLALFGAYLVLMPIGFPASPLMLAGGAVFGAWLGSLYNLAGTFAGGALSYFLGRTLGRDLIQHLGGHRLRRLEKRLARRSFWGLFGMRFLPFPYALVNYAAALVGIPPRLFLTSTFLGLLAPIFLYSWFAAELFHAAAGERQAVLARLGLALLGLAAVIFVPRVIVGWKRRRRLAELREARRGRQATP